MIKHAYSWVVGLLTAFAVLVALSLPGYAVKVEKVVSPGGIEAWLVRDHSIPITALEFWFRDGASTDPKGKTGLASMVSSLLDEGAGDLDSQAFQDRLERLSVRMSFSARLETFRGSLKTLNRRARLWPPSGRNLGINRINYRKGSA